MREGLQKWKRSGSRGEEEDQEEKGRSMVRKSLRKEDQLEKEDQEKTRIRRGLERGS